MKESTVCSEPKPKLLVFDYFVSKRQFSHILPSFHLRASLSTFSVWIHVILHTLHRSFSGSWFSFGVWKACQRPSVIRITRVYDQSLNTLCVLYMLGCMWVNVCVRIWCLAKLLLQVGSVFGGVCVAFWFVSQNFRGRRWVAWEVRVRKVVYCPKLVLLQRLWSSSPVVQYSPGWEYLIFKIRRRLRQEIAAENSYSEATVLVLHIFRSTHINIAKSPYLYTHIHVTRSARRGQRVFLCACISHKKTQLISMNDRWMKRRERQWHTHLANKNFA